MSLFHPEELDDAPSASWLRRVEIESTVGRIRRHLQGHRDPFVGVDRDRLLVLVPEAEILVERLRGSNPFAMVDLDEVLRLGLRSGPAVW